MRRATGNDHLSGSLTDLMTSLMVIFVLLLVTKLNNQAGHRESSVRYVLDRLNAHAQQFKDGEQIERQGDVIVIVIPERLMSFKQASADRGGAVLAQTGREYLERHVPGWANILCSPEARKTVDTIVVEGHSDTKSFSAASDERTNEEKNLELSQQRSMAVVADILGLLETTPEKGCFRDLLSATGRGDAHPLNVQDPYSPQNRRVQFKIRMRPDMAVDISDSMGARVRD
jgi:hypothetical protein